MKKREYSGPLAEHIEGLVAEKHASGYGYVKEALMLQGFDALTKDRFPDIEALTKDAAIEWAKRRDSESAASLLVRIGPIRQLAFRMQRIGHEAFVLERGDFAKPAQVIRHVFTKRELALFFVAADDYPPAERNTSRRLVAQVLFRTIYCLGLRPGEAAKLTVNDVDLADGTISIYRSKGNKDRMVYLTDDLKELLVRFDSMISRMWPDRKAFFTNYRGKHLSSSVIRKWFRGIWESLPEEERNTNVRPTVMSFRHTFACERIRLWSNEGKDLRSVIYYLCEHMGHDSFRETEYYLHFLPENFGSLLEKAESVSEALFPEVM